jgi:hypothetical protein
MFLTAWELIDGPGNIAYRCESGYLGSLAFLRPYLK